VSGGADSLALLVLAVESGCEVSATHVDHGLRPRSAEDSLVVADVAAKWGARFHTVRVQVPPGPNLEARARAARYEALPADVLTRHPADDQAETVLRKLLRRAGSDGLAAMRRDRRPLLSLRRAETHDLCAQLGLEPVDDETNVDRRFRRNRIRHDLLPLLDAIAERDVADLLSRQADLLRDDADLLDALARELDPTDARVLATAPVALGRRAVRLWLSGDHPPEAATVERVLAVARGEAVATEIGKGRRVVRHRQRLAIEPGKAAR
jgi:tRNA(Ile)-lysidine synthase